MQDPGRARLFASLVGGFQWLQKSGIIRNRTDHLLPEPMSYWMGRQRLKHRGYPQSGIMEYRIRLKAQL